MKVLGIDPGYERLGIAVIEKKSGKEHLLFSECFKTPPKLSFEKRLLLLGVRVEEIIGLYAPDILAIENLFVSNNQKTAMRVSEVRGAIIFLASKHTMPVHEYTPLQVKNAITGYGKSDKTQVANMVERLIAVEKTVMHDDEMDAIAITLTGSASVRSTLST